MNHKNSKTVVIFRAGSFLSRAQNSEVDDFLSTTKKSIGSYWENASSRRIGSGLSYPEESILLPPLVDATAEDREFRKKVSSFYLEIDTQIPHQTGKTLEIGLEVSNTSPISDKNFPINLMDFLRYRHILNHPMVAKTKEEADSNSSKEYYIFDKSDVIKKNTLKTTEKDAAMQIYLEIKNEEKKVDDMLIVLGTDPREFTGNDASTLKLEELRKKAEEEPGTFVALYQESDLDVRAWIKAMTNTGVFTMIGPKYLDGETKKLIGNTTEEVIYFFKDEENSEVVSMLKARLQEASKKPVIKKRKS